MLLKTGKSVSTRLMNFTERIRVLSVAVIPTSVNSIELHGDRKAHFLFW